MRKILFVFLLLTVAGGVNAADFYVDASTGDDSNDGSSWAAAKATIYDAVNDACQIGGTNTVKVAAGFYGGDPTDHSIFISCKISALSGDIPPGEGTGIR